MTAQEIIESIQDLAAKDEAKNVSPSQLSQLAAVMGQALKAIGVVDSKPQRFMRVAILGLIADREIKSSKELSPSTAIALISRWTQMDNPFQPTAECLSDIPVLVTELAAKAKAQEEASVN